MDGWGGKRQGAAQTENEDAASIHGGDSATNQRRVGCSMKDNSLVYKSQMQQ